METTLATPLPQEFIDQMRSIIGTDEARRLAEALQSRPVTAVRFNPGKYSAEGLSELMGSENIAGPVEWCRQGFRLKQRPKFTLLPQLHAGAFYVQDASSMVISHVAEELHALIGYDNLRWLDACAAPGGKSIAALSALPPEAFVVANEFNPSRAQILVENITKWGATNSAVTQGDTALYKSLKGTFDVIAIDAPCSGEGMMRKDDTARSQWSKALVEQCADLQQQIIANLWPALKPGGYLVYSTCTFNRLENEQMIERLINDYEASSVAIPGMPVSSSSTQFHAYRFMPHITEGEGLFIAVVQKPGRLVPSLPAAAESRKAKGKKQQGGNRCPATLSLQGLFSEEAASLSTIISSDEATWSAIPTAHKELITLLAGKCRLMQAGTPIATQKGRKATDLQPHHALALAEALRREAFPRVELTLPQALSYLRREADQLSQAIAQVEAAGAAESGAGAETAQASNPWSNGYLLLTYQGLPLGFCKKIGNRANNLYPQHWRIRQ